MVRLLIRSSDLRTIPAPAEAVGPRRGIFHSDRERPQRADFNSIEAAPEELASTTAGSGLTCSSSFLPQSRSACGAVERDCGFLPQDFKGF